MDGLEFIKQLSTVENAKGVPVVMITTEGSESHVVQALSCGARGYIRKPSTPDQVKEHVIPMLGGKIMRSSVNGVLATSDRHEDWTPLLELAARRSSRSCAAQDRAGQRRGRGSPTISMVGTGGEIVARLVSVTNGKSAALMASKCWAWN